MIFITAFLSICEQNEHKVYHFSTSLAHKKKQIGHAKDITILRTCSSIGRAACCGVSP